MVKQYKKKFALPRLCCDKEDASPKHILTVSQGLFNTSYLILFKEPQYTENIVMPTVSMKHFSSFKKRSSRLFKPVLNSFYNP